MQNVGKAEMVSAVAEAGALAFITAFTFPTPESLRQEIRKVKSRTKNPFGVNFTLLPAINPPDYDAFAKVAVAEGITIFETSGNPMPIIKTLRSVNSIVIHKCVSIKHAKKAQSLGVDAISIDGFECAGHPGEDDVTSLILLARCHQELQIPYIASGGFADARGAAAAFSLGACAVNMGTRWLCTVEAPVHDNIKRALVGAKETDTNVILKRLNNSVRCFKNDVSDKVAKLERYTADFSFDQVKTLMAGARGREAYDTGNIHAGIWSAGQSQALIYDIPTCKVLVDRLERDTIDILKSTPRMIIDEGSKL